jgi:hypothetical protein
VTMLDGQAVRHVRNSLQVPWRQCE